MGEYEYKDLFKNKNDKDTFLPVTSRIVFFVFTMLASIVLINLMIGLAVNDIQGLEKEVGYTKSSHRVSYYSIEHSLLIGKSYIKLT